MKQVPSLTEFQRRRDYASKNQQEVRVFSFIWAGVIISLKLSKKSRKGGMSESGEEGNGGASRASEAAPPSFQCSSRSWEGQMKEKRTRRKRRTQRRL